MGLKEELFARTLPKAVVTLPPSEEGGAASKVPLCALGADVFEALEMAHPPTDEQRARGFVWNVDTFRPALLAASAVSPEGEALLTEEDWRQLITSRRIPAGDINLIFSTALQLNDRSPLASVGKD